MSEGIVTNEGRPASYAQGRVSHETLARWATVRRIAELEEALQDSFHSADRLAVFTWAERARAQLVAQREELRRYNSGAAHGK